MKLLSVLALAALALTQVSAHNNVHKCFPSGCYRQKVPPPGCKLGKYCDKLAAERVICPWKCGKAVPKTCYERPKPCPEGMVCIEHFDCEVVCPPGQAKKLLQ
ncbi:hypothetical protein H4R18_003867 [Coemansia javaensis]|uniref:Uncharacterized protein n=1 Tax=Coemansia javaensis TaxID=2761396 RepID=A0A9W8HDZ0_9FUNG|nr:hypothetical protein H4R18_003867 [Coemansia javaensis]